MKLFVVLSALVVVALCSPPQPQADLAMAQLIARRRLPALDYEEKHDDFGQFALRYVTAEGTVVSERGRLVPNGHGDYVLVTEGEISYVGDDGELYVTKYSAGIEGVKMEGEHHPLPRSS